MKDDTALQAGQVFEAAAELFGVLSTPARLRIISGLCDGEKNVSQLQQQLGLSQPSMSRHLGLLYQSGVLAKRRSGAQVFYRVADASVVWVCKAVCSQIGVEEKPAVAGKRKAGQKSRRLISA